MHQRASAVSQSGRREVSCTSPGHFSLPLLRRGRSPGAAIADYDRDGWLDIYFCLYLYYQGTDQYKYPSPYYDAENGPPNFLMRNQRDGTFRDVTAQTGLDKNNTRYSFCCGWNDYNHDGWPDFTSSTTLAARIFTATTATEPLPTSHRRPEWKTWARA